MGGFYRRHKNKKRRDNAIPTSGESGYPQEMMQIPRERTTYYQNPSQFQSVYNHGQENIHDRSPVADGGDSVLRQPAGPAQGPGQ